MKSKSLPPSKRRWKQSNDEEENEGSEEGLEMRDLPETTKEDKDYYYEHLSNIGTIIILTRE